MVFFGFWKSNPSGLVERGAQFINYFCAHFRNSFWSGIEFTNSSFKLGNCRLHAKESRCVGIVKAFSCFCELFDWPSQFTCYFLWFCRSKWSIETPVNPTKKQFEHSSTFDQTLKGGWESWRKLYKAQERPKITNFLRCNGWTDKSWEKMDLLFWILKLIKMILHIQVTTCIIGTIIIAWCEISHLGCHHLASLCSVHVAPLQLEINIWPSKSLK